MKNTFYTIALTALLTLGTTVLGGSVFATNNSQLNHPSYWGENCYKVEYEGQSKYFSITDKDVSLVVVKGGTTNKVYEDGPFVDLTAEINPNSGKTYGISHVIVCTDSTSVEEPEFCEFNQSLQVDDPNCKEDAPEEPNEPEQPVDEDDEDGNVEGAADEINEIPSNIRELPKTGGGFPLINVLGLSALVGAIRKRFLS